MIEQPMIEHEQLSLLYKFVYNVMDYKMFALLLEQSVGLLSHSYCEEKWDLFKKDMIGFLVAYDSNFLHTINLEIIRLKYEG